METTSHETNNISTIYEFKDEKFFNINLKKFDNKNYTFEGVISDIKDILHIELQGFLLKQRQNQNQSSPIRSFLKKTWYMLIGLGILLWLNMVPVYLTTVAVVIIWFYGTYSKTDDLSVLIENRFPNSFFYEGVHCSVIGDDGIGPFRIQTFCNRCHSKEKLFFLLSHTKVKGKYEQELLDWVEKKKNSKGEDGFSEDFVKICEERIIPEYVDIIRIVNIHCDKCLQEYNIEKNKEYVKGICHYCKKSDGVLAYRFEKTHMFLCENPDEKCYNIAKYQGVMFPIWKLDGSSLQVNLDE